MTGATMILLSAGSWLSRSALQTTIVALKQQTATGSLAENTALSVAYPRARKLNGSSFTSEACEAEAVTADQSPFRDHGRMHRGTQNPPPSKACGFDPHLGRHFHRRMGRIGDSGKALHVPMGYGPFSPSGLES